MGEITFEAVRPRHVHRSARDELRRNAHPLAFPHHGAFHHQINVQSRAMSGSISDLAVVEGRGAGRDT